MIRQIFGYMVERPLYFVSFLVSMVPLWFPFLLIIYRNFDIFSGMVLFFLIICSKIYIETEITGENPFSLLFYTILRMGASLSLQISAIFLMILLAVAVLLEEKTFLFIVSILTILVFISLFLLDGKSNMERLWGYRELKGERLGIISRIFYQIIWLIIIFKYDYYVILLGLVLSFYFHMKGFLKKFDTVF